MHPCHLYRMTHFFLLFLPPISSSASGQPNICIHLGESASLSGSSCLTLDKVPPLPLNKLNSHTTECGNKHCEVCLNFEGRRVLFSTVSKRPYTFHENFLCADTFVIYCNYCKKMYIGLTSNNLRTRFYAHWHFSETKKHPPSPISPLCLHIT